MSEFVHLHLHTEYSLLDGACRIEELLDQAAELKMPALAVTEHGNMFSAVVFHDAARKRGINPILGCEVYVAPGDRRDKTGTPGETANHLVLLAETPAGFKNLIALVSSGYTDGFYYKPRIDKALLAAHADGLDRPEQLPQGRGGQRDPHRARQAGDGRRRQLPRHPRRRQLLPRDAVPGHRRAAGRQHRAAADRPGPRAAAGLHQRRALPAPARRQAARPVAVHRHREVGQRREAAALPRRPVLPQDRGADGRGVRRLPRGDGQHRWPSPSAATSPSRRASTTCPSSRCRPARRSTSTSSR